MMVASGTIMLLIVTFFNILDFATPQNSHTTPSSQCYAKGQAYPCMPPFTNIAEGVPVTATNTCGNPPSHICRKWIDHKGKIISDCDDCDAKKPTASHPASLLTDRHYTANQTCWISGDLDPYKDHVVNLTLSLHKRFEVYYISLQPCGRIPDSIAIYKSSDFGKTWRPWQYFSTNCYKAFGKHTSNEHNSQITTANLQEVLCLDLNPLLEQRNDRQTDQVIAFSTTIGRPSTQPWSPALIDWMTMTDLRISLIHFKRTKPMTRFSKRIQNPNMQLLQKKFGHPDDSYKPLGKPLYEDSSNRRYSPYDAQGDSGPIHFSFSDLAVGGRCKCNGHANRCIKKNGKITCACQHNTEGADCERCKPSYFDRPWARATIKSPNVCKKCDCNLHSNKCKFNKNLYLMNGRTGGGVCEKCQHNTAGRRCHYCKDGYYRDWTKPLSHERVCLKCRCHPIGSVNPSVCDKKDGQCMCKEGVTGTTCERCKEGYKQTRDGKQPCARVSATTPSPTQQAKKTQLHIDAPEVMNNPAATKCKPCSARKKRIRFKKFCRKKIAFQATINTREGNGDYIRFEAKVNHIWRSDGFLIRENSKSVFVWIHKQDLLCSCPTLQLGATFLIITDKKSHTHQGKKEMLLTKRSIALPWQKSWKRRLSKFKRRERRGKCKKFDKKNKFSRLSGNRKRYQAFGNYNDYWAYAYSNRKNNKQQSYANNNYYNQNNRPPSNNYQDT